MDKPVISKIFVEFKVGTTYEFTVSCTNLVPALGKPFISFQETNSSIVWKDIDVDFDPPVGDTVKVRCKPSRAQVVEVFSGADGTLTLTVDNGTPSDPVPIAYSMYLP